MKKKKGTAIAVQETYLVFVQGAENFEQAKEIWDEQGALDSPKCEIVKWYEDEVWEA